MVTGVEDVRKLALVLVSAIVPGTTVVSSPYLRTQQTASILASVVDSPVSFDGRLGADRSSNDMIETIREYCSEPVIVIGHLPTVAVVAAQLLQLPSVSLDMPPGTAVGLRWVSRQRMLVDLLWMLPPYLANLR